MVTLPDEVIRRDVTTQHNDIIHHNGITRHSAITIMTITIARQLISRLAQEEV